MTEHLNDEQLDKIAEHVAEVRQNGRPTILYTDEGILEKTYMSLSTDVVEQLITGLRAERAAHQATRAELNRAQSERDTAQRRAKGEQNAHSKVRSWAVGEVQSAYQKIGRITAFRDRIQAERDCAKQALFEVVNGNGDPEIIAQAAIDAITSGAIADDVPLGNHEVALPKGKARTRNEPPDRRTVERAD